MLSIPEEFISSVSILAFEKKQTSWSVLTINKIFIDFLDVDYDDDD